MWVIFCLNTFLVFDTQTVAENHINTHPTYAINEQCKLPEEISQQELDDKLVDPDFKLTKIDSMPSEVEDSKGVEVRVIKKNESSIKDEERKKEVLPKHYRYEFVKIGKHLYKMITIEIK